MIKITKNCQKIINLLSDYPEKSFFSKEIAEKLSISLGGAHNTLKYLAEQKIVHLEQKGNMKFYQVDGDNSLVKQLRKAVIVEKLMPLIDEIKNNSQAVILFGSASRGEQTADSDIDLFVLTHNLKLVKNKVNKLKGKIKINPVIKTPNQWSELEVKEPEFYNEVKQGIELL